MYGCNPIHQYRSLLEIKMKETKFFGNEGNLTVNSSKILFYEMFQKGSFSVLFPGPGAFNIHYE